MTKKKSTFKSRQLPSGNYRVSLYLGKDENGKRIYKSFTAPTEREAQYAAQAFKYEYADKKNAAENIPLSEAFKRYIDSKENVLSPSTVRGYRRIMNTELKDYKLKDLGINDITQETIQRAVNEYSLNHSPKTTRNFHGLISAVLSVYRPSLKLSTTMPQKKKIDLYVPSDEDIKTILQSVQGEEIEKAIMLAAFGSLRRSEISALTAEDVKGAYITINKAMVLNDEEEWVVKQPKTFAGYRTLEMPQFVIDRLPKRGKITELSPNAITKAFARVLKRCGVPHFRFHDLRHYQASILHAMGVPDKYIIARGGWRTEATLKNIYQHTMDKKRQEVETQICCHFSQMMNPCNKAKMQHNATHNAAKCVG